MSEVQNSEEQTLVAGLPWTGNVRRALSHWGYEDAKTKLLSLSENAVFRVEATDGSVWVLRLHRPGYRSAEQVESEMAWLDAVRADVKEDLLHVLRNHIIPSVDECAGARHAAPCQ